MGTKVLVTISRQNLETAGGMLGFESGRDSIAEHMVLEIRESETAGLQELVELGIVESYKVMPTRNDSVLADKAKWSSDCRIGMADLALDTDSEDGSDTEASDVEEACAGSEKEKSPKPKGKKKKRILKKKRKVKGKGRKKKSRRAKKSAGLAEKQRSMWDRLLKVAKPSRR